MIRLFHGISGWRCGNAGDIVSAPLIRGLLEQPVDVVAEPESADMFAAGSILHNVPTDWRGTVWGSGLIRDGDRVASSLATIIALRGPLTAKRCGSPDVPLGDPGILVSRVWPAAKERRYRLGLVPHYVDGDHEGLAAFARRNPETTTTIDICGRVADVLRAMTECDYIISSSLHGLVFADSYGIPNAWVRFGDKLVGGSFKFRDYYGATLAEHDPIPIPFQTGEPVETMIARIEDAYRPAPVEPMGDELFDALRGAFVRPEADPSEEA